MSVRAIFLDMDYNEAADASDEVAIAVAPAIAITLFRALLPGLAAAQARAAARLQAAERVASPLETLHVACGDADEEGWLWVAVADAAQVGAWISVLDEAGYGEVPIIPAPLLLPAPAAGFSRAELGGETVMRGAALAFADDTTLSPLLIGDAKVIDVGANALAEFCEDAAVYPPLDLRQGVFARKHSWQISQRDRRSLALVASLLALVSLAIPLAQIVRLNRSSAAMELQSASLESAALGGGVSADERLNAMRGPGAGFTQTLATVRTAVQATPNAELSNASFESDGTLTITIHASAPAELEALKGRIIAAGFDVSGSPPSGLGAQPSVTMEVKGR